MWLSTIHTPAGVQEYATQGDFEAISAQDCCQENEDIILASCSISRCCSFRMIWNNRCLTNNPRRVLYNRLLASTGYVSWLLGTCGNLWQERNCSIISGVGSDLWTENMCRPCFEVRLRTMTLSSPIDSVNCCSVCLAHVVQGTLSLWARYPKMMAARIAMMK